MRLIDAEELINNLSKAIPYIIDDTVTDAYVEGLRRAKIEIEDMPTIESGQKTGKWIGGELGECSVCGHYGCASDIWDRCEEHYCPNCGSKLEV